MEIGSLTEVLIGQKVKIIKLNGDGALKKRLLDMGLTPGVSLKVERVAPFGGPVELTVRGYALSLRKEEAALIMVEQ